MLINNVKPEQIKRTHRIINYKSFIVEYEQPVLYIKIPIWDNNITYITICNGGEIDITHFNKNDTFEIFNKNFPIYPVDRDSIKCDTVVFNTCTIEEARNQ